MAGTYKSAGSNNKITANITMVYIIHFNIVRIIKNVVNLIIIADIFIL